MYHCVISLSCQPVQRLQHNRSILPTPRFKFSSHPSLIPFYPILIRSRSMSSYARSFFLAFFLLVRAIFWLVVHSMFCRILFRWVLFSFVVYTVLTDSADSFTIKDSTSQFIDWQSGREVSLVESEGVHVARVSMGGGA